MEHKVKICSECGAVKPLDEFVKNKECKDGREPKCKSCRKEYFKKYYVKNRDEILENQKKYYVKNRDKIDERNRKYRAKNRDKILEYKKKYRAEHRDKQREYCKKYYAENRDKCEKRNEQKNCVENTKSDDNTEYWDRENKNRMRNLFVSAVNDLKINHASVLCTESPEFILTKLLKTSDVFIAEHDKAVYKKLLKNKPENVSSIYFGDISFFKYVDNFDAVFLDFCCTYEKSLQSIIRLHNVIKKSYVSAFTFCMRGIRKELTDEYVSNICFDLSCICKGFYFSHIEKYCDKGHDPMCFILAEKYERLYNINEICYSR